MTYPADRATLARYRAFGAASLRLAAELAQPITSAQGKARRSQGGPLRMNRGVRHRRALKDARWAYTACARVVLVNREQIAAADREAARRMAHSDNHDRQRAEAG